MNKQFLAQLCATASCVAVIGVGSASAASLDEAVSFDIPAQALDTALLAFSQQSGIQVISASPALMNKRTAGVRGHQTARSSLAVLLQGSDLAFVPAGDKTVTIVVNGSRPIQRVSTAVQDADAAARTTTFVPPPVDEDATVGEVVVTASRVVRTGFTAPTPTTVLGLEQILTRAAPDIVDVINEIPAFRPTQNQSANALGNGFGSSSLDLRGMNIASGAATARTLVLVDGRRVVPNFSNGLVDLNLLPSSLVQRTEVVTGGASAAWGADAVAGVVSLILKDRIEGVEGSVSYGQSDKHDYVGYNASLATGGEFSGGRGRFVVGGEYNNNRGVGDPNTARSWSRARWNILTLPASRAAGLPARVIVPDVQFSDQLTAGGIVVGGPLDNTTFLPGGRTGTFAQGSLTSGQLMTGGDNGGINTTSGIYMLSPLERYSGLARATFEIDSDTSLFAEASYGHSYFRNRGAQIRRPGNITIRRENPFLPDALVQQMTARNLTTFNLGRYLDEGGTKDTRAIQDVYRVAFGVDGKFGTWSWDAYYSRGENHTDRRQVNTINPNLSAAIDAVRAPDGSIICNPAHRPQSWAGATAPDPGCVPINLFGVGSPSSAALAYISGEVATDLRLVQDVVAANISGDLIQLPAGALAIAAGVEYRRESAREDVDPNSALSRFDSSNPQAFSGRYDVKDVYFEADAPLLRDQPFARSLSLNAAVRRTDYSTSGAVMSWKIGAVYEPASFLRLRATESRDIRAPNMQELFAGDITGTSTVPVPGVGNIQTRVITSSNPNLRPEIARTTTVGAVVNFAQRFGVRASIDYFDIRLEDIIAQVSAAETLNRCLAGGQTFCNDIVFNDRREPTRITNRQFNFSQFRTSGYDIAFNYDAPIERLNLPGNLALRAIGTHVTAQATTDTAGKIDRVGQQVPRWAWTFGANYRLGRFAGDVQLRTISEGVRDVTLIGPEDEGYDPRLANSISSNRLHPVGYVNLSLRYRLVDRDGRNSELFGAVNNVFDVEPPRAGTNNSVSAVLYDLVGRTFRVGVRFQY